MTRVQYGVRGSARALLLVEARGPGMVWDARSTRILPGLNCLNMPWEPISFCLLAWSAFTTLYTTSSGVLVLALTTKDATYT